MEVITEVFLTLLDPGTLLFVLFGTLLGIVFGMIPGLSGPIGIALLLPVTFALAPVNGLLMLGGIYMGSHYGGAITAILLNTPGHTPAVCTAMDGYPMARQGRGKEALYMAVISSVTGGLIGVLVLIFFTPFLARVALRFGPPEMLLVAVGGLVIAGSLTSDNMADGLFAVGFGLLLAAIGADVLSGATRLTFGISRLRGGIPLVPLVIGLFVLSEVFVYVSSKEEAVAAKVSLKATSLRLSLSAALGKVTLLLRSSLIGTFVGVLPGAGGAVASFICYAEAKRKSLAPESFGKGNIEGIIATESGNNAAVGGAIVPLMALGIPGSTTTAIMYGAITIHGLVPGPRLFADAPVIAYSFLIGMLLVVVVMGITGIVGIPIFAKISIVPLRFIIPGIMVFSFVGAYSVRNSMFDVLLAIILGMVGFAFKRMRIPAAPVVLGVILGPLIERNLRRTITIGEAGDVGIVMYFLQRPIVVGMLLLLVVLLVSLRRQKARSISEVKAMKTH